MTQYCCFFLPPPPLLHFLSLPFSIPSSQDEPDPFYDLEQHALLGVANIYVEALHHDVRHEYDAPIIAPTGKVRNVMSGCLNVSHDQWRSQVIGIGRALAPLLLCVDDISCHVSPNLQPLH